MKSEVTIDEVPPPIQMLINTQLKNRHPCSRASLWRKINVELLTCP